MKKGPRDIPGTKESAVNLNAIQLLCSFTANHPSARNGWRGGMSSRVSRPFSEFGNSVRPPGKVGCQGPSLEPRRCFRDSFAAQFGVVAGSSSDVASVALPAQAHQSMGLHTSRPILQGCRSSPGLLIRATGAGIKPRQRRSMT